MLLGPLEAPQDTRLTQHGQEFEQPRPLRAPRRRQPGGVDHRPGLRVERLCHGADGTLYRCLVEAVERLQCVAHRCEQLPSPKQPFYKYAQRFEKLADDYMSKENFAKAAEFYDKAKGLYEKAAAQ